MKSGLTDPELSLAQIGALYGPAPSLDLGLGNFIMDFIANFAGYTSPKHLEKRDGVGELMELLDMLEGNQ